MLFSGPRRKFEKKLYTMQVQEELIVKIKSASSYFIRIPLIFNEDQEFSLEYRIPKFSDHSFHNNILYGLYISLFPWLLRNGILGLQLCLNLDWFLFVTEICAGTTSFPLCAELFQLNIL
jgi:hypothetical protein